MKTQQRIEKDHLQFRSTIVLTRHDMQTEHYSQSRPGHHHHHQSGVDHSPTVNRRRRMYIYTQHSRHYFNPAPS